MTGQALVLRGDARALPLPDESVDLIVTSPPYYSLRAYTDGGEQYAGQIGSEATPAEYIDTLIGCTREWVRVLKPAGSLFVNLGDKYSTGNSGDRNNGFNERSGNSPGARVQERSQVRSGRVTGMQQKSLLLLPERYRIAAVDQLGLIARAVMIWNKPNGLPESVTDRVRRSHEDWVHLTKQPRYFAAVDEIREPHQTPGVGNGRRHGGPAFGTDKTVTGDGSRHLDGNPLGKLPGSVWEVASEPLAVPARLGVDHFACVDTETEVLSRRGWLHHDEVRVGDEVAGYNLDTGVTSWTRCHAVHRYDFDGELVSAEARGLSMRLTPNHRTLVHDHRGRHRLRGPVEVIDAAELHERHAVPQAVVWADDGYEKSIGADLAALFGWVAAEGWYSSDRRRVYLSQSETANPAKVVEIAALLGRLGDDPLRTERARTWRGRPWTDAVWRLGARVGRLVLDAMPDKLLPIWVADLPLPEARALLDAFIDGDGHRRPDGRMAAYQKHRHNLDVIQVAAVRLGYNTTLRNVGNRWVLYMSPPRPARLRKASGTSLVGRERYVGMVWCVTTGTGTFVARRRGSVFVTGNSFPLTWPRRLILGWSPPGICVECGEGRRPVVSRIRQTYHGNGRHRSGARQVRDGAAETGWAMDEKWRTSASIAGSACACTPYTDHPGSGSTTRRGYSPGIRDNNAQGTYGRHQAGEYERVGPQREYHLDDWTPPPTRPAVVLDPFAGSGTTPLVARALGRVGIGVDRSFDYCRLAVWRTNDPAELAKAMRVPKPPTQLDGQESLFDGLEVGRA